MSSSRPRHSRRAVRVSRSGRLISSTRSASNASKRCSSASRVVRVKSVPSGESSSTIRSPSNSFMRELQAVTSASRFSGICGVRGAAVCRIHSARSACTIRSCSCRSPIFTPGRMYSLAARRRRERCILLISMPFSRRHAPVAVAAIRSVTGRSYTVGRNCFRVSRMRCRIRSCPCQSAIVRPSRNPVVRLSRLIASRRDSREDLRVRTSA